MTESPADDGDGSMGERRHAETPFGPDHRGSAARQELRFLVTSDVARGIEAVARARLTLGDAESDSPWYTTTYCDTRSHDLYRAALVGAGRFLRFREYHSRRPELVLAGHRLWIEWKEEDGQHSSKQRLVVHPRDVLPFLRGEPIAAGRIELRARESELFERGLRPVVVTQCRRVVYASRRDQLRVTFDHELTYLEPSDLGGPEPAMPYVLGPIIAQERGVVVEIKWQEALPDWAADLVETLRDAATDRPGKFVVAMQHVAGSSSHPG